MREESCPPHTTLKIKLNTGHWERKHIEAVGKVYYVVHAVRTYIHTYIRTQMIHTLRFGDGQSERK